MHSFKPLQNFHLKYSPLILIFMHLNSDIIEIENPDRISLATFTFIFISIYFKQRVKICINKSWYYSKFLELVNL